MDGKEKQEMDLMRLQNYAKLGYDAVFERYKLLPQISALSATLLVVATFNEKLLPLTNCVRALLIGLFALIPISLGGYLWELKRAEEHSFRNMEKLGNGQKVMKQSRNSFTAYLPQFVAAVISMAIIFIIFSIAKNFDF